jgi:hypothetical protein
MSNADQYETDVLAVLFTATALATVFQNHVTSPIVSIFVSLHTTPGPADTGDQTTLETSYGGYVREAVVRTSGGWTVATGSCSPVANIDFVEATSGTPTLTHAAFGRLVTTAGQIFYHGTVTPNIVVATGVTPRLTTASTITEA